MKINYPAKAKKGTYRNLQKGVRALKTPQIDTWENEYPDKDYWIEFTINEFTCICPKTGLPDFAEFRIRYVPDKECVELKSFKEYFMFYRDVGVFHEHVTNRILEDFVKACRPRKAEITSEFNIRGGIKTRVSASYCRAGCDVDPYCPVL
ncbi:MAG: preQ(1) synthase [Patescibacteria group bacterium]